MVPVILFVLLAVAVIYVAASDVPASKSTRKGLAAGGRAGRDAAAARWKAQAKARRKAKARRRARLGQSRLGRAVLALGAVTLHAGSLLVDGIAATGRALAVVGTGVRAGVPVAVRTTREAYRDPAVRRGGGQGGGQVSGPVRTPRADTSPDSPGGQAVDTSPDTPETGAPDTPSGGQPDTPPDIPTAAGPDTPSGPAHGTAPDTPPGDPGSPETVPAAGAAGASTTPSTTPSTTTDSTTTPDTTGAPPMPAALPAEYNTLGDMVTDVENSQTQVGELVDQLQALAEHCKQIPDRLAAARNTVNPGDAANAALHDLADATPDPGMLAAWLDAFGPALAALKNVEAQVGDPVVSTGVSGRTEAFTPA